MNLVSEKLMRLAELRKLRPQYAEIYDFYTGLCEFLQDRDSSWLTCTPELESWPTRRQSGFPLLSRDALQIDTPAAAQFISLLIDSLVELGKEGGAELQLVRQGFDSGKLASDKLLIACLEKNRAPLEEAAAAVNVPSALLEYVCSTALAFGLQQWSNAAPQPSLAGWQEGYCPICGAVPAMGEFGGEEGQKKLHCSICATGWEMTRLKCSYCGNEESDSLEYFTAEGDSGYRVDICRKCSCYLKVVDSRELGEGLPMDVEDLNTMHLDLLAQKEGFAKGKIDQKS